MGLVNFLIKVGLDTTDVSIGAKQVESKMSGLASNIGSHFKGMLAGFIGVAAIEETFRKAVDMAGKLTDQMKRLGVSSEFLQGWGHGFKMAGADDEQVTKFFEKLRKSKEEAIESGKPGAFSAFGIDKKELGSTSLEETATKIARAFRDGASDLQRAKFLDVGGKGAGALIPAFTEDIEASALAAKELGLVMDDLTRVKLDDFGDSISTLGQKIAIIAGKLTARTLGVWEQAGALAQGGMAGVVQAGRTVSEGDFGLIKIANEMGKAMQTEVERLGTLMKKEESELLEKDAKKKATAAAERLQNLQRRNDAELALVHPSAFKSSGDNRVSSMGGYYLGSGITARMDLERQNMELLKKIEQHTHSTAAAASSIEKEAKQ